MDNPRFLSLGGGHPRHFHSGGNLVNCMGHAKLYVFIVVYARRRRWCRAVVVAAAAGGRGGAAGKK